MVAAQSSRHPKGPRSNMATSVNQVLVSVADRAAMFRLRGRATAKESTGFKAAADGLRGGASAGPG